MYFDQANLIETLEGNIVLSVGSYLRSDDELGLTEETKRKLDQLHLRKIEMSDEILVINMEGYIGDSTAREIIFALGQCKPVRFLDSSPDALSVSFYNIWTRIQDWGKTTVSSPSSAGSGASRYGDGVYESPTTEQLQILRERSGGVLPTNSGESAEGPSNNEGRQESKGTPNEEGKSVDDRAEGAESRTGEGTSQPTVPSARSKLIYAYMPGPRADPGLDM